MKIRNLVNNNANFGKISWGSPSDKNMTMSALCLVKEHNDFKNLHFVEMKDIEDVFEKLDKEEDTYTIKGSIKTQGDTKNQLNLFVYADKRLIDGVSISLSDGKVGKMFTRPCVKGLADDVIKANTDNKNQASIENYVKKLMNKFGE